MKTEKKSDLRIAEIVREVSFDLGYPKKDVEKVFHTLFEEITKTLASGDRVLVEGLGRFYLRKRKRFNTVTHIRKLRAEGKPVVEATGYNVRVGYSPSVGLLRRIEESPHLPRKISDVGEK